MAEHTGHRRRFGRTAGRSFTVLVVASLMGAAFGAAPAHAADPPTTVCTIGDARIDESSGLAMSLKHPGVMYTHGDSGNSTEVFALDAATCAVRAVFTVAGTTNSDWEAMSVGKDDQGRPAVFVGDIGDNLSARSDLKIHRFAEPDSLTDQTVTPTTFAVSYADGKHDAETLMIDPRDNRLYIATKILFGTGASGVYQGPATLSASGANTFTRVGNAPLTGTDGGFAPNGKSFTIRDYGTAYVFTAPGVQIAQFALPSVPQGESLTYTPDGKALLVGTEGANSPVWKVPLPPEAIPGDGGGGDQAPVITPPGNQATPVGANVNLQIQVAGSPAPTCTASGLPDGLAISPSCLVTGAPTTQGTRNVVLTASSSAGTAQRAFVWTVTPGGGGTTPPAITAPPVTGLEVGKPVNVAFAVTGNPAPTCSAIGLPAGLAFSPACVLSGTPTAAGTSNAVFTAANSVGTASAPLTLTVAPAPGGEVVVTNPGDKASKFNQKADFRIQATPSTPGATLAYSATGLPFGVSVDARTGAVTGPVWGVGTFQVKITVRDGTGKSGTAAFGWTVTWF